MSFGYTCYSFMLSCQCLHTTLRALARTCSFVLALRGVELIADGECGLAGVEMVVLHDAVVA